MNQFLIKLSTAFLVVAFGLVAAYDATAQSQTISGKVVDNSGLPVIGCFFHSCYGRRHDEHRHHH